LLRSFIQKIRPGLRLIDPFRNKFVFYGEGLLAPRPTPKLEDHPLSFSMAAYSIYSQLTSNWRPSLPSAIQGHAMPWWQGDPPNMAHKHSDNLFALNALRVYLWCDSFYFLASVESWLTVIYLDFSAFFYLI
jgi:hypothetical protein